MLFSYIIMVSDVTPYSVDVKKWRYKKRWLSPAKEVDLVDENTGEIVGRAMNSTFNNKYSDSTRFVKLYDADVLLNMSRQGIGVFAYILKQLGYGDTIYIDVHQCMYMNGWSSAKSVYNGISEMICLDIIRKCKGKRCIYFVNPNIIYRGDRSKIANLK